MYRTKPHTHKHTHCHTDCSHTQCVTPKHPFPAASALAVRRPFVLRAATTAGEGRRRRERGRERERELQHSVHILNAAGATHSWVIIKCIAQARRKWAPKELAPSTPDATGALDQVLNAMGQPNELCSSTTTATLANPHAKGNSNLQHEICGIKDNEGSQISYRLQRSSKTINLFANIELL